MPPSAFETLARLQVDYPMLFKLSVGDRETHCGVLEFTAEEGCVYIPFWMMQNLLIEEGTLISVRNVSLPKATFVKLQPQSVDFLEISNPRAVLEHALRNFSCVTKGDVIQLPYNNKNFHFELKEVEPSPAACIIETDCNVDFDAPVGYKEPEREDINKSARSSACPSPTTLSTASSVPMSESAEDSKPAGVRIVDGKIIRPEDTSKAPNIPKEHLAPRTGQTGVQLNAAIPDVAPAVDYWAVQAGEGARLDGKRPTELKDAQGNMVDIKALRAAAAQQRVETSRLASLQAGKTLHGKPVVEEIDETPSAPAMTRKSRTGAKFSRLKQTAGAFQGNANTFK
jgi:ubiquitin fusion degradation protein 1